MDGWQRLEISLRACAKSSKFIEQKNETDFNVVSEFIRPNENRLSDIIACLLDANGSHGQGSKFLNSSQAFF